MRKCIRGTAIAVAALTSSGAAQAPLTSSCVFDTTAFRDSFTVWLSLEPPREAKRSEIELLTPYAIAIAQSYRQPSRVSFRTWPGTYGKETDSHPGVNYGGFGMEGVIRFAVDQNGHLLQEPEIYHDSPEIMLALRRAIWRADSSGSFVPPEGTRRWDERRFMLRIRSQKQVKEGAVTFARLPISAIRLEEEPRMLRPGVQQYPEDAKHRGEGGKVVVYYVIDRFGRTVPHSIVALELSSDAFAQATEAMLLGATFAPAKAGGCPVSTGVYQIVNFVLQ